jgi:RNA polymerase sigma factor for flagellar operon FliA
MSMTDAGVRPEQPNPPDEITARREKLWEAYWKNPNDEAVKDALVREYLVLVKAELQCMAHHLPRYIDPQDLYADGAVGLLSALHNFDPTVGVHFEVYARRRIWGAMLDRVRALDGVPRSSRKAARMIEKALSSFLHEHSRHPDESELAEALNVSTDELHELERQAGLTQNFSIDALSESSPDGRSPLEELADSHQMSASPMERLDAEEMKAELVKALKLLPDRERAILTLYYTEGLMLKEIAAAMEVTDSRVSQMHSRALSRLRAHFEMRENLSDQPTNTRQNSSFNKKEK